MNTRPINISGPSRPNLSRTDRLPHQWVEPNPSGTAPPFRALSRGYSGSHTAIPEHPRTRSRGHGIPAHAGLPRRSGRIGSTPCPQSTDGSIRLTLPTPPPRCSSSGPAATLPTPTTPVRMAAWSTSQPGELGPNRTPRRSLRFARSFATGSISPAWPSGSPRSSLSSKCSTGSASGSRRSLPPSPRPVNASFPSPHPSRRPFGATRPVLLFPLGRFRLPDSAQALNSRTPARTAA